MEHNHLLVVGARGMAGADFMECWPDAIGLDLPEFDITDRDACRRALATHRPAVVVNAAAATAVDWCETHRDEAFAVNGAGAGHLATACAETGALLVHISTDYVFDGASTSEYGEDATVNPLSVYAESKLAGERAVMAADCDETSGCDETTGRDEAAGFVQATRSGTLLIRIGWLFGHNDKSFVRAIVRAAGGGAPVRVIDDQIGCPTYSVDLAEAIERLVDAGARGLFHFTNSTPCTRLEMAHHIMDHAGFDTHRLVPIKSTELSWVAVRPAHTVLSTAKYTQATGAVPPHWRAAIDRFLRRDGLIR